MFAINVVRSNRVWNKLKHLPQIEIGVGAYYGVKKINSLEMMFANRLYLMHGFYKKKSLQKCAREKPFERFCKGLICKNDEIGAPMHQNTLLDSWNS